MGAAPRSGGAILEAVATATAGAALAAAPWSLVGLGWPAAVVGAANGAIGGVRRIYEWREARGVAAFVLDSTWALPMSAAGLVAARRRRHAARARWLRCRR